MDFTGRTSIVDISQIDANSMASLKRSCSVKVSTCNSLTHILNTHTNFAIDDFVIVRLFSFMFFFIFFLSSFFFPHFFYSLSYRARSSLRNDTWTITRLYPVHPNARVLWMADAWKYCAHILEERIFRAGDMLANNFIYWFSISNYDSQFLESIKKKNRTLVFFFISSASIIFFFKILRFFNITFLQIGGLNFDFFFFLLIWLYESISLKWGKIFIDLNNNWLLSNE